MSNHLKSIVQYAKDIQRSKRTYIHLRAEMNGRVGGLMLAARTIKGYSTMAYMVNLKKKAVA